MFNVKEYNKKYYQQNKEEIFNQKKKYYLKNKEQIKKKRSKYYLKNKEKCLKASFKYRINNKKRYAKMYYIYQKNKLKKDKNYLLRHRLGTRIYLALKGINKSKTTMKLIGCSIEKFKKHLASKFTKGMSWNNYGKWHIDHIIPCASFDLSKASEQCKCFHYTNLQPLWARENLKKGKKKG